MTFGNALAFFASFFLPNGNQAKALCESEGAASIFARMKAATKGLMTEGIHVISVRVTEGGQTIFRSRVVSGPMIYLEKLLGRMGSFASHCEARACRYIPLKAGQRMILTSAQGKPPCGSCQDWMTKKALKTGAEIIYRWRDSITGITHTWRP